MSTPPPLHPEAFVHTTVTTPLGVLAATVINGHRATLTTRTSGDIQTYAADTTVTVYGVALGLSVTLDYASDEPKVTAYLRRPNSFEPITAKSQAKAQAIMEGAAADLREQLADAFAQAGPAAHALDVQDARAEVKAARQALADAEAKLAKLAANPYTPRPRTDAS